MFNIRVNLISCPNFIVTVLVLKECSSNFVTCYDDCCTRKAAAAAVLSTPYENSPFLMHYKLL